MTNHPARSFLALYQLCRKNFFKHIAKANHHEFLEDVSFQIIDRVFGDSRLREGFWQSMLHSFILEGLNVRSVDR